LRLGDQPKERPVPIKAPGTAFLYDLYARLVVAIQEFVCDLSFGRFVSEFEGLGAVPLHAHDSHQSVRQDALHGGAGFEILSFAPISDLRGLRTHLLLYRYHDEDRPATHRDRPPASRWKLPGAIDGRPPGRPKTGPTGVMVRSRAAVNRRGTGRTSPSPTSHTWVWLVRRADGWSQRGPRTRRGQPEDGEARWSKSGRQRANPSLRFDRRNGRVARSRLWHVATSWFPLYARPPPAIEKP
jgi:hypothetical protein